MNEPEFRFPVIADLVPNAHQATIVLALLPGVGHIYLGFIKRGIIIAIGLLLWILASFFVPIPSLISWLVGVGYYIWQIIDAHRLYEKLTDI